jgi:hypothetical protein
MNGEQLVDLFASNDNNLTCEGLPTFNMVEGYESSQESSIKLNFTPTL